MSALGTLVMDKRWYIVHAYSNFEKKVADSIREQAKQRGLGQLFDEVMVPTEKVVEVRRGRKVDAERKFFPGYVLVKCELTDEVYYLIKNTPKVTGFLGADNKPMPISDAEAARILHQAQDPLRFRVRDRHGLVVGAEEARHLRRVLDVVIGLVGEFHLHQHVAGKELPLGVDLAAPPHLHDLFGRHHDLVEQVLEVALLGLLANGFGHLALEVRVGVHDVPALGHGFGPQIQLPNPRTRVMKRRMI